MLDIRAESVVYVMRQMLLPSAPNNEYTNTIDRSRHMKGLVFSFDVMFFDQVERPERGVKLPRTELRRRIHIMVAGYSSVFVSKSNNHNWEDREWLNLSNHDSEWLSALGDEFRRIYFDMCSAVDKNQRPCDIGTYNSFDLIPIRYVDVTWVHEGRMQPQDYYRKVVAVRKLSKEEFDNL